MSHTTHSALGKSWIWQQNIMYKLITAFALPQGIGKGWSEVDLSQKTITQIRSEFAQVHLHVTHTSLAGTMRMELQEILENTMDHDQTIPSFFANNGKATRRTYKNLVTLRTGEVIYRDAFQAGYDIEPTNRLYGINNVNNTLDAVDAIMRKNGVDPYEFQKNCLVAINGLFHVVDADADGIYVKDAYKTCLHSQRNEVGIVNFKDVSSFTYMPITASMLKREGEQTGMGDKVYITIPEKHKNKLVALVAGGYFHLLDLDSFYRVSDTVFCYEIRNIDFLDRFFESEQIIDLSSLGLERAGRNKMQLSREQLFSDEVITKWMTISQSFLIFFDNPYISKERLHVETDTFPGMYLSVEEPTFPLFHLKGSLGVYWRVQDDMLWEMRVKNNAYQNYLHHTTSAEFAPNPADNAIPHNTVRLSHAHFLKISTSTIVLGQ